MSNERIDLTWLEGKITTREERIENICGDYDYVEKLLAELKTCYEAIDVLSKSTIDDAVINMRLAKTLAKQNRDIEDIIDCLDGVDSIFGEEIIGMLRPLLARF